MRTTKFSGLSNQRGSMVIAISAILIFVTASTVALTEFFVGQQSRTRNNDYIDSITTTMAMKNTLLNSLDSMDDLQNVAQATVDGSLLNPELKTCLEGGACPTGWTALNLIDRNGRQLTDARSNFGFKPYSSQSSTTSVLCSDFSVDGNSLTCPYRYHLTWAKNLFSNRILIEGRFLSNQASLIKPTSNLNFTRRIQFDPLIFLNATWVADPTQPFQLKSSGAIGTPTYQIITGTGTVNAATGMYTPSTNREAATVRITDQAGRTKDATITQIPTRLWTNGRVNAVAFDGVGGMYVGGSFTMIGRQNPAPYLSALDLNTGIPDPFCDFRSGFNGKINALATTSDAIYVGGSFTQYRGVSVGYLVKLNLNCELDTIFTLAGSGLNNEVTALVVSGSSLYAGGWFNGYRGVANNAQRLAKLDLTTGNLDTTFSLANSGFNSEVYSLAAIGSSLYVGGYFTQYRGVANNAQRLAKLDLTNGNLDTTFTVSGSGFNDVVQSLAVSGSSLYVGGWFNQYRGVANSAIRLAKLDLSTGNLDTTFTLTGSGFNSTVWALAVSGSSLYVGGDFTAYRGVANSAHRLAKVNLLSGVLDTTFTLAASGLNSTVFSLAASGSSLYIGGFFHQYRGVAFNARYLAKLDLTSGNLDTTFTQAANGFNGEVNALAVSGSTLYVGGTFTLYRGVANSAHRLAKLDLTSGNLDTTFTMAGSGFSGTSSINSVYALVVSGSSLYVGGRFTQYRGVPNNARYLAKLDLTTGNLDTTFTQNANGFDNPVYALAFSGSSLYVGGHFTQYRGVPNSALNLAKIDLITGNLDTVFTQSALGFNIQVNVLAVSGSSLYVGGWFTTYRNVLGNAQYLAKLDLTSGNLDTTFTQLNNGFDNIVETIAVSGSSLYVGGGFSQYRGVANNAQRLAKLDLTTGNLDTTFTQSASGFDLEVSALAVGLGSIYVGGNFTQYRGVANSAHRLAKLNLTSGNLDTNFTQSANGFDNSVIALAVSGSSLYVGGVFTQYRGSPNNGQYLGKFNLTTGDPD